MSLTWTAVQDVVLHLILLYFNDKWLLVTALFSHQQTEVFDWEYSSGEPRFILQHPSIALKRNFLE